MKIKARADQLAHDQGLCESRENAKRLIMAGKVGFRDSAGRFCKVQKPGQSLSVNTALELLAGPTYVSRGAFKLASLAERYPLAIENRICLDAGASTGGFTDYLLQHGASRVYAVDVGLNQLHEKLRNDRRVISLEKTNLRLAPPSLIPEGIEFFCADLSFISLTQVLPNCLQWLKPDALLAVLIKPQFELSRSEVKKGVVTDPGLQKKAVEKIEAFCTADLGLQHHITVPSAIKGPKGNQEYMSLYQKIC